MNWFDPDLGKDLTENIATTAAMFKGDAVARDREGSSPRAEALILKKSGLTGLTFAVFRDGDPAAAVAPAADRRWRDALQAVRRIARTDLSPAALLGYNFMTLWRVENTRDAGLIRRAAKETLENGAIWGGANNPKGPAAVLMRVEGGYRLSGRKTFATGSQSADFLVVGEAVQEDGVPYRLRFILPRNATGLSHGDDWDGIGARRTASGSVLFDDVLVPDEAIVSKVRADRNRTVILNSSGSLSFQILFVNLLIGAAQGAIEQGAALAQGRDQPHVAPLLGELIAGVSAAAALADRATEAFATLVAAAHGRAVPLSLRASLADTILQAKVAADRAALDATSRIFEVTGARSATTSSGLDRFWRDVRTYTLHDPVTDRQADIGRFALRPAGSALESHDTSLYTL